MDLTFLLKLLGALTGRTFHRVKIDQGATGWTKLGDKADGKTWKLHYLFGTVTPGGTLQIVSNDEDDGTGTDEDLTGDMPLGANGGLPIGPIYAPDFCPTGTTGEAIGIRTGGTAKRTMSGHRLHGHAWRRPSVTRPADRCAEASCLIERGWSCRTDGTSTDSVWPDALMHASRGASQQVHGHASLAS